MFGFAKFGIRQTFYRLCDVIWFKIGLCWISLFCVFNVWWMVPFLSENFFFFFAYLERWPDLVDIFTRLMIVCFSFLEKKNLFAQKIAKNFYANFDCYFYFWWFRTVTTKETSTDNDTKEIKVEIMRPKSGIAGDERNVAVLLFLYVLQGIPLGLAAAVPLILTNRHVS